MFIKNIKKFVQIIKKAGSFKDISRKAYGIS
jgi:hypothetical protein